MSKRNVDNRFVVLKHEMPANSRRASHWDLMLEFENRLETWALAEAVEPGKKIAAVKLPRHRLNYLNYEGPISEDRGVVHRVLSGIWLEDSACPTPTDRPDSRRLENGFPLKIVLEQYSGRWSVGFVERDDGWIVEVTSLI